MTQLVREQHEAEIIRGERFQFGKNWANFLGTLNDERISVAVRSLQIALRSTQLDGKTFLDVGSGSGLFSLAARRLGAIVHSFDYDPSSVVCAKELKRRFYPTDNKWSIEQGSVLDSSYLAKLGTFDIVYSWGVLHHTGHMWQALDNVKPLVKPNGQLYIAIYNDLGPVTDRWRTIKRTYNRLRYPLRLLFALSIIGGYELRTLAAHLRRHAPLRDYIRTWTQYQASRGMNRWHDWIDWIGGFPYECATFEDLIDCFSKDGFKLEWLLSRANGTGCNETVFRRKANLGVAIDNLVPKSRLLLRRSGHLINTPVRGAPDGYIAKIPDALLSKRTEKMVLFRDGALSGSAVPGSEPETLVVAPSEWSQKKVAATKFHVVAGRVRRLELPFKHCQGHKFAVSVLDLKEVADDVMPNHDASPIFIFEDGKQLGMPHAIHAEIVKFGAGRFSHWSEELLFSSSDNSDPRTNGRTYTIVIAELEKNYTDLEVSSGVSA